MEVSFVQSLLPRLDRWRYALESRNWQLYSPPVKFFINLADPTEHSNLKIIVTHDEISTVFQTSDESKEPAMFGDQPNRLVATMYGPDLQSENIQHSGD